jgi:SAM-dependent methyltransferase
VLLLGAAAAAVAAVRHGRHAVGRTVSGGILVGGAGVYDALSRLMLGSLYGRIAADIATVAPDRARVLEVGCGPGHLSIRLVRQHGLDVTGLDLDPAMIQRARANAERRGDGSFDLVVSMLSMHHWADPTAGLAEIGRVLRPGARALVWDFRPGGRPHPFGPRHTHMPDPAEHVHGSPLQVVTATPWPWPWRFHLTQRIELVRADGPPGRSGT